MSATNSQTLSIFAPAKINLYLHVTGKRKNGYHELDSLITFADIGDSVTLKLSDAFNFEIDGPYAASLNGKDNLIVRGLQSLAKALNQPLNLAVTLTKNLPVAAGIGGGSADTAAALWGALKLWGAEIEPDVLNDLMLSLGADVPVCFSCQTQYVSGIGEVLNPIDHMPEVPVVLVNPGKSCATQDVFHALQKPHTKPLNAPGGFENQDALFHFLLAQNNDLAEAAQKFVPEIDNVLRALNSEKECKIARLSGSGATCFGLFENEVSAQLAAQNIKRDNPDWWVKSGMIGQTERY